MADRPGNAALPVSGVLFSALDATAKHLSAFLAVPLLVWARYLVHLLIMLASVAPRLGWRVLITTYPWLMGLRGVTLDGVILLGQLALKTATGRN